MSPTDAVQLLGAILIVAGIAVYRLPLRCGHDCAACEFAARQKRRQAIADAHYTHARPHPECFRCDEQGDRQ